MQVEDRKLFGEMYVLIIEEDDLLRGYHTALLKRLGITCEPLADCAGAARALEEADENGSRPDICFVSWKMLKDGEWMQMTGGTDGAQRMQTVCLVKEAEADLDRIRVAGADAMLTYPINQAKLYHFLSDMQKEMYKKEINETH